MTVIFQNCIDFALLTKELNALIFDPKIRRKVGFGYLRNQIPNLLWKTGSRLRGNCCGYWKTFRGPFIPENMEKIGKNWG